MYASSNLRQRQWHDCARTITYFVLGLSHPCLSDLATSLLTTQETFPVTTELTLFDTKGSMVMRGTFEAEVTLSAWIKYTIRFLYFLKSIFTSQQVRLNNPPTFLLWKSIKSPLPLYVKFGGVTTLQPFLIRFQCLHSQCTLPLCCPVLQWFYFPLNYITFTACFCPKQLTQQHINSYKYAEEDRATHADACNSVLTQLIC